MVKHVLSDSAAMLEKERSRSSQQTEKTDNTTSKSIASDPLSKPRSLRRRNLLPPSTMTTPLSTRRLSGSTHFQTAPFEEEQELLTPKANVSPLTQTTAKEDFEQREDQGESREPDPLLSSPRRMMPLPRTQSSKNHHKGLKLTASDGMIDFVSPSVTTILPHPMSMDVTGQRDGVAATLCSSPVTNLLLQDMSLASREKSSGPQAITIVPSNPSSSIATGPLPSPLPIQPKYPSDLAVTRRSPQDWLLPAAELPPRPRSEPNNETRSERTSKSAPTMLKSRLTAAQTTLRRTASHLQRQRNRSSLFEKHRSDASRNDSDELEIDFTSTAEKQQANSNKLFQTAFDVDVHEPPQGSTRPPLVPKQHQAEPTTTSELHLLQQLEPTKSVEVSVKEQKEEEGNFHQEDGERSIKQQLTKDSSKGRIPINVSTLTENTCSVKTANSPLLAELAGLGRVPVQIRVLKQNGEPTAIVQTVTSGSSPSSGLKQSPLSQPGVLMEEAMTIEPQGSNVSRRSLLGSLFGRSVSRDSKNHSSLKDVKKLPSKEQEPQLGKATTIKDSIDILPSNKSALSVTTPAVEQLLFSGKFHEHAKQQVVLLPSQEETTAAASGTITSCSSVEVSLMDEEEVKDTHGSTIKETPTSRRNSSSTSNSRSIGHVSSSAKDKITDTKASLVEEKEEKESDSFPKDPASSRPTPSSTSNSPPSRSNSSTKEKDTDIQNELNTKVRIILPTLASLDGSKSFKAASVATERIANKRGAITPSPELPPEIPVRNNCSRMSSFTPSPVLDLVAEDVLVEAEKEDHEAASELKDTSAILDSNNIDKSIKQNTTATPPSPIQDESSEEAKKLSPVRGVGVMEEPSSPEKTSKPELLHKEEMPGIKVLGFAGKKPDLRIFASKDVSTSHLVSTPIPSKDGEKFKYDRKPSQKKKKRGFIGRFLQKQLFGYPSIHSRNRVAPVRKPLQWPRRSFGGGSKPITQPAVTSKGFNENPVPPQHDMVKLLSSPPPPPPSLAKQSSLKCASSRLSAVSSILDPIAEHEEEQEDAVAEPLVVAPVLPKEESAAVGPREDQKVSMFKPQLGSAPVPKEVIPNGADIVTSPLTIVGAENTDKSVYSFPQSNDSMTQCDDSTAMANPMVLITNVRVGSDPVSTTAATAEKKEVAEETKEIGSDPVLAPPQEAPVDMPMDFKTPRTVMEVIELEAAEDLAILVPAKPHEAAAPARQAVPVSTTNRHPRRYNNPIRKLLTRVVKGRSTLPKPISTPKVAVTPTPVIRPDVEEEVVFSFEHTGTSQDTKGSSHHLLDIDTVQSPATVDLDSPKFFFAAEQYEIEEVFVDPSKREKSCGRKSYRLVTYDTKTVEPVVEEDNEKEKEETKDHVENDTTQVDAAHLWDDQGNAVFSGTSTGMDEEENEYDDDYYDGDSFLSSPSNYNRGGVFTSFWGPLLFRKHNNSSRTRTSSAFTARTRTGDSSALLLGQPGHLVRSPRLRRTRESYLDTATTTSAASPVSSVKSRTSGGSNNSSALGEKIRADGSRQEIRAVETRGHNNTSTATIVQQMGRHCAACNNPCLERDGSNISTLPLSRQKMRTSFDD